MRQVISASRRTDIPAFFSDWFIEKLKAGYVCVRNPFNKKSIRKVSLKADDVHTIVLWSKNFGPLLDKIDELKNYHLFFNFTINDSRLLEPNVPDKEVTLRQIKWIAEKFGPERINWRFDPIVMWDEGKSNADSFYRLADPIAKTGVTRCYFSFAMWYGKCIKRAKKYGFNYCIPNTQQQIDIVSRLAEYAKTLGITMYSCCNDMLIIDNISKAHCIDGELLSRLSGYPCSVARDTGQREQCGCTKSIDIGSYYPPCQHKCIYCYANPLL